MNNKMGRKKKVEDFEVEVKTKKASVKVKKEGKNVDAEVKTKKVKASVKKDETKKEFALDTDKLDVVVTEQNGEVKAEVKTENSFLRAVGNAAVKIFSRNFRRRK
jgi:hypothetical protein